jgi:hypothetical protein
MVLVERGDRREDCPENWKKFYHSLADVAGLFSLNRDKNQFFRRSGLVV